MNQAQQGTSEIKEVIGCRCYILNRIWKFIAFRVDLEMMFLPGKSQLSLVKVDLGVPGHEKPETEKSLYTLPRFFSRLEEPMHCFKNI